MDQDISDNKYDKNDFEMLQQGLDNYAESVTGRWACLSIHGHLVATSSDFHELDTREARLVLLLAAAQDGAPLRDTPVYLPQMSPNVCYFFYLVLFRD